MRLTAREAAVMLAIGCVIGTAGDRVHTVFNVLRYPTPIWQDEAWFVPLEFALAGLLLGVGHRSLRATFGEEPRPPSWREHAAGLIIVALAYLATGLLRDTHGLVALCLYGSFIPRAILARSRVAIAHALLAGAIGSATEATVSSFGVFEYLAPGKIAGVPWWLPGIYLHAALFARGMDDGLFAAYGAPAPSAALTSASTADASAS